MLNKRSAALAGAILLTIGAAACSSDDSKSLKAIDKTAVDKTDSTDDTTATTKKSKTVEVTSPSMPDISLPSGITLPPDFTLPDISIPEDGNISKDMVVDIIVAMSGGKADKACIQKILGDEDTFDKVLEEGPTEEMIKLFSQCF